MSNFIFNFKMFDEVLVKNKKKQKQKWRLYELK